MAYWNVGAGGWGHRGQDGWDHQELGRIYDPRLIRRLLPYLRPYRWRAALALVAMLVGSAAGYVQPWLIALAVGDYILTGDEGGVARVGLALIGLGAVSWVAQWAQRMLTGYIGHRILLQLRRELFGHLQKLSLSFYDRNEVGRVMSRVTSDVVVLQELLTSGVLNIIADLFGLALIVFLLFSLDVELSLVTIAVIPLLIGAMWLWQRLAARAFIGVRQAIATVNANLNESVAGVRVVQSLGREDTNLRQFERLNRAHRDANLHAARLQGAVMPLVEMLSTTAAVLVLLVIARRTFGGSLDSADALIFATAFTLYIQRFFNPVRDLVLQYTQIQRAMAGAHRVFEVLDTEPAITDAPDAIALPDVRGRVDFHDVSFHYLDGIPVLHGFDLHVEPGETIALVGQTGAGKTTVTALVNRSYEATGGRIEIDGVDLRRIERHSLTRRMAVVLQDPFLFSGTVADNIRYGRLDATDEEVREAARTVGADGFIEQLPGRYEAVLHERGQNLSIGQRQLIAFARAIIADPRILILDEATANVDSRTEQVIQRALGRLLRGRTSFVIAHRLSTIRNADRIVVMDAGRIAEIGTHEELLAQGGHYARLHRMTYAPHETAQTNAPTSADGNDNGGPPRDRAGRTDAPGGPDGDAPLGTSAT